MNSAAFSANEDLSDNIREDEAFVKEMSKRVAELESGAVKAYSWEEVKRMTREALKTAHP